MRKTTPEQQTVYLGELYERVTDLLTGTVEHRYYVHGAERTVAMVRPWAAPPGDGGAGSRVAGGRAPRY